MKPMAFLLLVTAPGRKCLMTPFEEDRPVPSPVDSTLPRMPRLFGDAEAPAVVGHGGGVEGVGEADDRDTGAMPNHGGAIPGGGGIEVEGGDLGGLRDRALHAVRAWRARFAERGPAGLDDKPLGRPTGSRLPEATKRAILLLKEQHPNWGQDRIAAVLLRAQGFSARTQA